MVIKGQHIKFIADHTGTIDEGIVADILFHCRHNIRFALVCDATNEAMVYFPKELCGRHTGGTDFKFTCIDNFIDSIKLTLYEYRTFISLKSILPDKPTTILLCQ